MNDGGISTGTLVDIIRMMSIPDIQLLATVCNAHSEEIMSVLGWRYGLLSAQPGSTERYEEIWALFTLGRGVSE